MFLLFYLFYKIEGLVSSVSAEHLCTFFTLSLPKQHYKK